MAGYYSEEGRAGEARKRYAEVMGEAFRSGFSVMEMARITGGTKPNFFYTVLRKSKLIPGLKRGRTPKIDLPNQIAKVFDQKKFSFVKWCHVWGFPVDEARQALLIGTPDPREEMVTKVHQAFRRDFPDRYPKLFPDSNHRDDQVVRLKTGLIPPDTEQLVSVSWNKSDEKYVASIYGEDGLEGVGDTWSQAIKDLEQVWWVQKAITRLTDALARNNS